MKRSVVIICAALVFPAFAMEAQDPADEAPVRRLVTAPNRAFHLEWKDHEITVVSGDESAPNRVPLPLVKPAEKASDPNETSSFGSWLLQNLPLAFVSPDQRWIYLARVEQDAPFDDLYRRIGNDSVGFELAAREGFRALAWRFLTQQLKLPEKLAEQPNWNERLIWRIRFIAWSDDSARLLLSLQARLDLSDRERSDDIAGVNAWLCYFNLREEKFELTDRLRAFNAGARKRWQAVWDMTSLPIAAESVGREGPWLLPQSRLERADRRLNADYTKRLKALPPDARERLRQEQREWLIQRDTEAAIYATQSWSPSPEAALIEGKAISTEGRAAELEKATPSAPVSK